ncbi:MAG: DNA-binding HxlR family transcriptional regulator [Paracoccaceae bacterium]|jgi:DNA-binding HxlR family transcriptional regulator
MRKQRHQPEDALQCPMEATLDLIGGKWKGVILFRLEEKALRFNELNRL